MLLAGTAIGAGGVVLVQERYLPARLTAEESAQVRSAYEQADAERQRLSNELAQTTRQLETSLAENKRLVDESATSRQAAERARADVTSLVSMLPADPRAGAVQVRAARFSTEAGKLVYDVVLSRDSAVGKPVNGTMQLTVTALQGRRGPETTAKLEPVAVSFDGVDVLHGSLPLPEGFEPRKATIQVFDSTGGKLLGLRIINVENPLPSPSKISKSTNRAVKIEFVSKR